ncbi:MAG: FlgD immunoglobulin-like domain containing protein, partial [Chthonomonadales bacterium]
TTIGFDLGNSETVALRVYDMMGHEIRTLVANEMRSIGHNIVEWDGRDNMGNLVSSGLFYYQIATPSFTQTVKMQVIR